MPSGLTALRRARSVLGDGCRRGSGVDELFEGRVDPKVETLERARAEQHQIAWLAKHDIIRGSFAFDVHKRETGPACQDSSIGLAETPLRITLDTERLEHIGWEPRQFGSGVDKN